MLEIRELVKVFPSAGKGKSAPATAVDPRERQGQFFAVDGISLRADEGKILGLLGPNGAGKTTLMRVLSTALVPTSGHASIHGIDIVRDPVAVRRHLGFLSGSTGLYGRLTPRELIVYFARLHGMAAAAIAARVTELTELLEMESFLDRRCDALSTGMKQRVNIARTLVHDPSVIIFDEPTTGLDVVAAEAIMALVERCRVAGKTVVLSTHHMHEVERVCDRVALVHRGKLEFEGTVEDMRERSGERALDRAFLALVGEVRRAA